MGQGGAHDLNVSKSPMSLWKATPPLPLAGSGELEGKGGKRLGAGRLPEVKVLAPGGRQAPSPLLAPAQHASPLPVGLLGATLVHPSLTLFLRLLTKRSGDGDNRDENTACQGLSDET